MRKSGITVFIAIVSVVVGIIGYAYANQGFARSIGLDEVLTSSKEVSHSTAKESKQVVPEEKPKTPTPQMPLIKSLDSVDPYYKTVSHFSYFPKSKTTDGNNCRGELVDGIYSVPLSSTFPIEYDKVVSPCPYELNLPVHIEKVCLRDDAPIELKVQVQPNCKEVWDFNHRHAIRQNIIVDVRYEKLPGEHKQNEISAHVVLSYEDKTEQTKSVDVSVVTYKVQHIETVKNKNNFELTIPVSGGGSSIDKVYLDIDHVNFGFIKLQCKKSFCDLRDLPFQGGN